LQHARDEAPTLLTVAKLANVSVASASRVLNGIRTNPETLARVTAAAEACGYVPNAAARSLRSRRTGQIAFAMENVANPVYTAMVASIQELARKNGLRLLLHSTSFDVDDELSLIDDLRQRYVDGLILASIRFTNDHVEAVRHAAVPVVVIGRPPTEARVDTVRAYSRRGAAEAVKHLHDVGRRRIALVNGPEATTPGSARRLGYLDGLRSCALPRDDELIEVASEFTIDPGRVATERLLARVRPDAILCANDLLALGTMSALQDAGLDVPGDVAIVGMDDTSLAQLTRPQLSSVDLGAAERGRLAAELLLKRIEHPGRKPRTLGVEPRLVVRASSGASA
jgi:LacI family transcriptional regulator, galactose operon repressor